MSGHTPGPWRATSEVPHGFQGEPGDWAVESDEATIAIVTVAFGRERANAKLIADVPDLLAALADLREACLDAYKAGRIPAEPFVRAGNVIAKATA